MLATSRRWTNDGGSLWLAPFVIGALLIAREAAAQDTATEVPAAAAAAADAQRADVLKEQIKTLSAKLGGVGGQVDQIDAVLGVEDEKLTELKTLKQVSAARSADSGADKATKDAVAKAKASVQATAQAAEANVTQDKNSAADTKSKIGCGGSARWCLFGGTLLASYSLTLGYPLVNDRAGQTGHRVVSLVLPMAGVRWAKYQQVSFDAALYSAIISPQFQVNTVSDIGTGCSSKETPFEDSLPCEGNAPLRPYLALFVGPTIGTGSSALGVISIGVTTGVARTAQDPNAFWFYGLMVGTGAVYFPLTSATVSK